jgi:two-component system LytT family sensor kinase
MNVTYTHTSFKKEIQLQLATIFGKGRVFFHIAIWSYLIWSTIRNNPSTEMEGAQGLQNLNEYLQARFYIKLVGLIGFIYSFLLLVIPYSRYLGKSLVIWIGLVLSILFWVSVTICLNYVLFQFYPSGLLLQKKMISKALGNVSGFIEASTSIGYNYGYFTSSMFTVIWLFFSFYYYIDLYDQQKNLNLYQKVLADKLEAESTFLKTQINPHFLFNTLNNMYSLALQQSDDAPVVTSKLRNLLHYMLYDCAQDKVPLAGEIDFLQNYITLEQIRNKKENIDIKIELNGNADGKEIAPLLLVNFVENAFKHGVKSGIEKAYVYVRILSMHNGVSMDVVNSIPAKSNLGQLGVKEAGGIGIKNVKRRLAILYPKRHKLAISHSEAEYTIHLNLTL